MSLARTAKRLFAVSCVAVTAVLGVGFDTMPAKADHIIFNEGGNWVANRCPGPGFLLGGKVCFYRQRVGGIISLDSNLRDSNFAGDVFSNGVSLNNNSIDITNGFATTSVWVCSGSNYHSGDGRTLLPPGTGFPPGYGVTSFRSAGCFNP